MENQDSECAGRPRPGHCGGNSGTGTKSSGHNRPRRSSPAPRPKIVSICCFTNSLRVFTTPEHPLVIFLDDLQWADQASLTLMQLLMSETTLSCLLLIGAYRDNEVSPAHPLSLVLTEIQKGGATFNTINLAPLNPSDINQLIADALSCSLKAAFPLSRAGV